MKPVRHPSNTRTLNAPQDWDQDQLPVGALGITDTNINGVGNMVSYWRPDALDLAVLNAGGLLSLSIVGSLHPPVSIVSIGSTAIVGESAEKVGADLFIDMVMPVIRAIGKNTDPVALYRFYSGLMGSAMGSLVADFGQEAAVELAQSLNSIMKTEFATAESRLQ